MSCKRAIANSDTRVSMVSKRRRLGQPPTQVRPVPGCHYLSPPNDDSPEVLYQRAPHDTQHHELPEIRLSVPDGSEHVLHPSMYSLQHNRLLESSHIPNLTLTFSPNCFASVSDSLSRFYNTSHAPEEQLIRPAKSTII